MFGPRAVLRARDAREIEGERDRSNGVPLALERLAADDGRDDPPSLTPPPNTVTLPPSYGVTDGVSRFSPPGVA